MDKTIIQQPSTVSHALDALLDNMYISNVHNRLRQLDHPQENDSKRWIWELIQNAKDSIVQDQSRKTVDIKVIVKDDTICFKHNGSPFTAEAQMGLLYKYSGKKGNDSESTGRFGTGFLTTHALSKIVSIEGDLYTDDNKINLCGFSATMYRNGINAQELLDGVKKMRESMIYTKELNSWTTYTYHLETEENKKALQLGLENLIANIAQVMLFCKELATVELDNNGDVTKITRNQVQQLNNEIYISEFEITGKQPFKRKFAHKKLCKHSDELSKRFKKDRNLRLIIAVEIDRESNLVENTNAPSHFCVLPLVGSEKHIMPFYLNSPDFEPDSERESLLLDGSDDWEEHSELGTIITVRGINRLILKESIELYESLVSYLSENEYNKLFLLAKGLKRTPDFEKNFNKDWFEKEIILPYREVLKKYAIVETESGNQKLFNDENKPNIIFPQGNKEVRQQIYKLATEILINRLPLEKYADNWAYLAWSDCGLFGIDDLCKHIAYEKNVSNLPNYAWLNNFLTFIKQTDETLLKKYALVPNSNGDFISLDEQDFAEGVGLTEFMLDTLLALGIDLKPNLLNPHITTINLPLKIDEKNIAEKINEQADFIINDKDLSIEETIEKLLPLINIFLTNSEKYSTDFIEKQKNINGFVSSLFENLQIAEQQNNDIPEKAWYSTHKWLISQLIDSVSEFKKIDSLPEQIINKIQWLNDFISFVSEKIKEGKLDEVAIIPNQNGEFCFKIDLSLDDNIPEILKSEQAENFGLILKNSLLHKDINTVNISNKKDINTVIELINSIFRNEDNLDFAIYLIHLLPKDSSSVLCNSQSKLLGLVQKYDCETCKSFKVLEIKCSNEDLWRKPNKVIIDNYNSRIGEDKTVEGLKNYLSEQTDKNYDFGDTIIFLNDYCDYLISMKITIDSNIVPNQNGDFCSLDDLFKDDNIPDELKEVLLLIDSENDFRDILAEKSLSLSIQPKQSKGVSDIAKLIDDSMKEVFSDSRNWDDEDFKKGVAILTEYFRKHKNPNDTFKYSWSKKDSIELNVLWSEKDREMLKELKENGFEKVQLLLAKDAEIKKLKEEKEALIDENRKLKEEKATLEQEIDDLKQQLENASSDSEKAAIEAALFGKMNLLQQKTNEMAVIGSCMGSGLSKQQQKEINEEARRIVKTELENRLSNEKDRQQEKGNNFEYELLGFDGFSNSPLMQINGVKYPIVVKSYKKQSEPFNINTGEWELIIKEKNSLFFVWDGSKINYIDILGLMRNQSHIDIAFSTENLDIEERLSKFSQTMRYFKDIQFKFSSFVSSPFGQATSISKYFFGGNHEDDVNDNNSDIML